MMNSAAMSNFEFRNNDEMVLVFNFNRMDWTDTLSCDLLGGIVSTSITKQAYCEHVPATDTRVLIRNVGGFVEDPLLAVGTNKRVKFMYKGTSLTNLNTISRTIFVELYANYDAYINNYQPIVAGTATQIDNCYDADSSATCYINHAGANVGSFELQKLSDTYMQVSYKPGSNRAFGSTLNVHYFDIAFSGFSFDSSCVISDVKVEISTTNTPGTGSNNTVDLHTKTCTGKRIAFVWNADREFSQYFGDQTSDDTWSDNEYLIFYITIQSPNPDLPALHHDYIYAVGTYYYTGAGPSPETYVRGVSYLPTQSLANSVTVSTLTVNRGANT